MHMAALGLPDETGLKKIKNRKEKHISKNDHKKVTFTHSFIHEVHAMCRALSWVPRSGNEQETKGPVLLEFRQV